LCKNTYTKKTNQIKNADLVEEITKTERNHSSIDREDLKEKSKKLLKNHSKRNIQILKNLNKNNQNTEIYLHNRNMQFYGKIKPNKPNIF